MADFLPDLIHGPDFTERLAAWAAARIPHMAGGTFGPCWAVGLPSRRGLGAVVVFHDWQPAAGTVQVSVAADGGWPRSGTRATCGQILGVAFGGLLGAPVRKVWSAMPSSNERAIRFNEGLGFKREATLRHHFAHGVHAVIASMMATEWRRHYGQERAAGA